MPTLRNLIALSSLSAAAGLALAQPAPPKKAEPAKAPAATAEKGRDWSRIDTNKDGLISPEEMEKFLAENPGPQRK